MSLEVGCKPPILKLMFDFLYITDSPTVNYILSIDFDECSSSDENKCSKYATCINTHASYECRCKKGFAGDGINCQGMKCHLVHSEFVTSCGGVPNEEKCLFGGESSRLSSKPSPM